MAPAGPVRFHRVPDRSGVGGFVASVGLAWFICCLGLLAYAAVTRQWLLMGVAYGNAAVCGVWLLTYG